jgi:hypothetical protein
MIEENVRGLVISMGVYRPLVVSYGNLTTMESQRVQLLNLLGSICCAPRPECSDGFETLLLLQFILLF